jgi:hypothetical protein
LIQYLKADDSFSIIINTGYNNNVKWLQIEQGNESTGCKKGRSRTTGENNIDPGYRLNHHSS